MVCLRFTSLRLGLLLSLATLGESFATTHQGIDALANIRRTFVPNKELQVDEAEVAAAATTTWKWLRGRKVGVEDTTVKEEVIKGKMNTGIGVHSPNSFGSPSINDQKSLKTLKMQGSSFELVKTSAETQNLEEATKELYNMLSKDYGKSQRRRPPINNHQPLEDFINVDDP